MILTCRFFYFQLRPTCFKDKSNQLLLRPNNIEQISKLNNYITKV